MTPAPSEAFAARQQRRIVARLAAQLGLQHLALAEDAVQTAVVRALQAWHGQGTPTNPAGWLYVVARRVALDSLRAQQPLMPWPDDDDDAAQAVIHEALGKTTVSATSGERFAGELEDDELALLFAACHPDLPQATQVSLALRTMAGLELVDVASAMLSTEAAVAQRLARARQLLAGKRLTVPAGAELAPRLDSVLTVLSLMFLAGQRTGSAVDQPDRGAEDTRRACWEAIRLARAVAAHPATAHADADALAALLLFHGARLTGRVDDQGDIIPLPGQPRDRWDAGMLRMGLQHLRAAQRAQVLSRWHLQAGIAAEHALAPSYEATDWPAIVRYYTTLLQMDPSAMPSLGHAIALAEAGDAQLALERLQALWVTCPSALRAHALAAMAHAHAQLGDSAAARKQLQLAIAAAPRPAEARLLQRRLDSL